MKIPSVTMYLWVGLHCPLPHLMPYLLDSAFQTFHHYRKQTTVSIRLWLGWFSKQHRTMNEDARAQNSLDSVLIIIICNVWAFIKRCSIPLAKSAYYTAEVFRSPYHEHNNIFPFEISFIFFASASGTVDFVNFINNHLTTKCPVHFVRILRASPIIII